MNFVMHTKCLWSVVSRTVNLSFCIMIMFQVMTDLHLLVITLVITGVGVVVLIIRSGLQSNSPTLVADEEEREGEMAVGIIVIIIIL